MAMWTNWTASKMAVACLGVIVTSLFWTTASLAVDFLTAADWQYLQSVGYEKYSYAFEKAAKGQQKHLHKLINNQRISNRRKLDLINSYIFAIGVESPMK
jgi:hypothetical protein